MLTEAGGLHGLQIEHRPVGLLVADLEAAEGRPPPLGGIRQGATQLANVRARSIRRLTAQ